MEGTAKFGPNVVILLVMSGAQIWYLVRAYVSPNAVPVVHCIGKVLMLALKDIEIILMGGLNSRLRELQDERK